MHDRQIASCFSRRDFKFKKKFFDTRNKITVGVNWEWRNVRLKQKSLEFRFSSLINHSYFRYYKKIKDVLPYDLK